jgi:hypothetical protein
MLGYCTLNLQSIDIKIIKKIPESQDFPGGCKNPEELLFDFA